MPDARPKDETSATAVSTAMKAAAWIMVAVPVLGTAAHVAMLAMAGESSMWTQWLVAYRHGWGIFAVAALACANLVASWLHYRYTGMGLAVVARILTYFWILSLVFIWRAPAAGV